MELQLTENLVQVIILDISGIYAQIYNQGYFDRILVDEIIKQQYSDTQRWRVVIIDRD